MAAVLDRGDPPLHEGEPLPPAWHWLYFQPVHRQSALGPDGHAKRGGFLPPVALPRRMWGGGRIAWHRPIPVGATLTRTSRVADVAEKNGRSGRFIVVVVRHEITDEQGVALVEEQDIVYREAGGATDAPAAQPITAPRDEIWAHTIQPDIVLLFRYSALTFKGHRIHYDRTFAAEEGYPGLVVHAPLIATLLLDLVRREQPARALSRFQFRALRPLFDTGAFTVCGRPESDGAITLWARDAQGFLTMQASAR
jgi:3-methylfumaryl-CoA hydratase